MYVESACYDEEEDVFGIQEQTYHNSGQQEAAMELQIQQQLNLEMEQCYNTQNNMQQLVQEPNNDQSNWEGMNFPYQNQENNNINNNNNFQPTHLPDLLNMFPLPNSSISFTNTTQQSSNVVYDPSLLPLNLPQQPPLLRELFQSLPHSYGLSNLGSNSLFNGMDHERDMNGSLYQDGERRPFDNEIFGFSADINGLVKNRDGKDTKHFATERQRRVHLNDKYKALRSMLPNPTKNDRASIVMDAIEYINELKISVNELKVVVEKKRCNRDRIKRQKIEGGEVSDAKKNDDQVDQSYNGNSLRSSWLQRRSKNTEVDVRIVDDEVTVKLVQQKRINCLLFAARVLDELQLDLHHVAGGLIGDYYSFLFNSKICEGSTVYASAIAKKLIEVVDIQYATIAPANSY